MMPDPCRFRSTAWLLAAVCLAGCNAAQPDASSHQAPSRGFAAPVHADPQRTRYEEVKATLQGMYTDGLVAPFVEPAIPMEITMDAGLDDGQACMHGYPCILDLADCSATGREYLGGDSEVAPTDDMPALADIALEVIRLQTILAAAGYPAETWKPQLLRFETDALAALVDFKPPPPTQEGFSEFVPGPEIALQESLKEALNAYRANQSPSLPEIAIEGGCGAGEIGIHVATSPANGRSRFIPVFHYRLCKARGVDPDDTAACDYWKEPADGVLFDVAGDYQYRVDWPDGSKRAGKFSFTHLEDGQTVTISKP